jgi:hypothetical protein
MWWLLQSENTGVQGSSPDQSEIFFEAKRSLGALSKTFVGIELD